LPFGIHAGRRAGELYELADLGVAVGDQRGDQDAADLLQREVEDHELPAVRQRRHDAVERFQAELEEVQREVVAQAVDLAVSKLALAVYEEDSFPEFRKTNRKFIGEGLVLPVALRAVPRRVLRRERDDAGQHQVELVKPPSMTMISPVT